ncbi:MAG: carboxylating nicotinate-nucleotide diphosphorylase [Planctomycetota bacterium]|jgi:nicotinate-nucleotide pyrophosphorylase (carboxylating)
MPLPDLNALPLDGLFAELTADGSLDRLLGAAVAEDLGEAGDVTTLALDGMDAPVRAAVVAREAGVAAGLAAVPAALAAFDASLAWTPGVSDGAAVAAGRRLGGLDGPRSDLLRVERTLLNLLGRLAGVATLTRRYVDAVAGTGAVVCDTRKTTPGLRRLEKYAVRCGGGTLHRLGLSDGVLIKDNHLAGVGVGALAETVAAAARRARALAAPLRFVGVEVDTLDQLDAVLSIAGADAPDLVLLDNMTPDALREAVRRRDAARSAARLEASGGVTLETVRAIAETGVDRIAVGALTHSAPALDVALDVGDDA